MATENPTYRWSKSNFPAGSIGDELVPEFIEGRNRTQATIDLPLQRLVRGEYLARIKQGLDVNNLGELLKKPYESLTTSLRHPSYSTTVNFILREYLGDIAVGPEGLFLYWFFGTDPEPNIRMPINVGIEQARAKAVRDALEVLTPQEAKTIDLSFGLTTGVAKSKTDIMQAISVYGPLHRPNTMLRLARQKLNYLPYLSLLRPFHAFREGSLGRTKFGVSCEYEFQQRLEDPNVARIDLTDLTLSYDFKQVVRGRSWHCKDRDRFMFDFLQLPTSAFTETMLEELKQEFQAYLK